LPKNQRCWRLLYAVPASLTSHYRGPLASVPASDAAWIWLLVAGVAGSYSACIGNAAQTSSI
jgi:hypothetical protein